MNKSSNNEETKEEEDKIDKSLKKCIMDRGVFKSVGIEKISKGVYKVENKTYRFKVVHGNNLAIRMFAGYIFAESLVHFEEELNLIVKSS